MRLKGLSPTEDDKALDKMESIMNENGEIDPEKLRLMEKKGI